MSFGIIRVRNLKSGDIAGASEHNKREFQEGKRPDNIQPGESGRYGFNCYYIKNDEKSILSALERQFNENGIRPRKNAVVALEYVLALSPDAKLKVYEKDYNASAMLDHLTRFIEKKHGKENVISIDYHFDESNPHAHVIVTPIVEKEVRYKNKYGDYTCIKKRLCARDYTGGKKLLRELQTEYYEHVKHFFSLRPHIQFDVHRGVDARKNKRTYIRETIQELAEPREKLIKAQLIQRDVEKERKKTTTPNKSKKTFQRFDPWKPEKGKGFSR